MPTRNARLLCAEFRTVRWSSILWPIAICFVCNLLLSQGDSGKRAGSLAIESLTPILLVPAFADVYAQDLRRRTHELILSLPRSRRVFARRLAILLSTLACLLAVEAHIWHAEMGVSAAVAFLIGAAPSIFLGGFAYLLSIATLNEGAAGAGAIGVWVMEQLPMFASAAAKPGVLRLLYLQPFAASTGGPLLPNKITVIAIGVSMLAVCHALLRRPERLLRE